MNKGILTKLSKYIKEIGGKETSQSRAGSYYYKLNGIMIRVSDHLPGIKSRDQICIILPYNGSGYSVFIDRVMFNFQTLKEVKLLLSLYVVFTLGNNAKEERITKVEGKANQQKLQRTNSFLNLQLNTLKAKNSKLVKLYKEATDKVIAQRKEINKLLHHSKLVTLP